MRPRESAATGVAIVSWQMPHGGFYKLPEKYAAKWNGSKARSEWFGADKVELGTIDNDGTVTEIMFLGNVYARSGVAAYRDSARRALDFILNMQSAAIAASAKAAVAWYKSGQVKLANTGYEKTNSRATNTSPLISQAGSTSWHRFYDLNADTGFFSGRLPTDSPPGAGKQYNIMNVEGERRYGYEWGGNYGTSVFAYTDTVGY